MLHLLPIKFMFINNSETLHDSFFTLLKLFFDLIFILVIDAHTARHTDRIVLQGDKTHKFILISVFVFEEEILFASENLRLA